MKKLFVAVLLLSGISFWACQKEFSYETTADAASNGAWEFKDSANTTYAGSPQVFYIDDTTNTSIASMQYNGVTTNLRGALSIGVIFPTGVPAPGTYTSLLGQVDFNYSFGNNNFYKAESGNQFSTENITVVISAISDTSVTGTFSGTALDSANRIRIVKEGKFTYKKRGVNVTPTAPVSSGALGTSTDSCTGAIVSGTYKKAVPMASTNTVTVNANVTAIGSYTIYSDTIKGIYFRGSSNFVTTGAQAVVIQASGTPTDSGTVRFRIHYGTSSCTFRVKIDTGSAVVVVPPTGDYFPLTTNSNWSYIYTPFGTGDSSYVQSTGTFKTISSNNFNIFLDDSGDSAFYRKSSGLYYQGISLDDILGAGGEQQSTFLKDNVPNGTSWADSFNVTLLGAPVKVKITHTIIAKAVSATVGSNTYPDVIKVNSVCTYGVTGLPLPIPATTAFTDEFWYARGTGVIYEKYTDTPTSSVTETRLRRVQIL